ncbi:hypothetical protein A6R68_24316 [Neotoma lepida]|uniref:Uncharacterized protein n=1 Tax=Neotoma lepida TaxID=56216 RepID=A0A1A6HTX6_NEOLE|nr:hypothetical protein A6R68_24316 [Neotoma lepida]
MPLEFRGRLWCLFMTYLKRNLPRLWIAGTSSVCGIFGSLQGPRRF